MPSKYINILLVCVKSLADPYTSYELITIVYLKEQSVIQASFLEYPLVSILF